MDLSLSDEQQQIVDSAVTFLQESSSMPAVRAASESASGMDAALWSGMAELGWCGVHLPEEAGGLGDGGLAGELGKVLGRLHPVGRVGRLDMAVRGDALIVAVTGFAAFELVDVLADQVALDAIAGHERQRLLHDFEFAQAGELI